MTKHIEDDPGAVAFYRALLVIGALAAVGVVAVVIIGLFRVFG